MNAFGKFKDGLGEVGRGVHGVAGSVGRGVGDIAGGVQGVAGSVQHAVFNAERHGEHKGEGNLNDDAEVTHGEHTERKDDQRHSALDGGVKNDEEHEEHDAKAKSDERDAKAKGDEGDAKAKHDEADAKAKHDETDAKAKHDETDANVKHDEVKHDSSAVPPPARSLAGFLSAPANIAKAALDAPRNVARKGLDVGASAAHAGLDVTSSVAHAGLDVSSSVAHAGLNAGSSVAQAGLNAGSSVAQAGLNAGSSVAQAGLNAGSSVAHAGLDAGSSVAHAGFDVGSSVAHAGGALGSSALNLTAAAAHSTLDAGAAITHAGINFAATIGAPAATIGTTIAHSTLDITSSAVQLTTSSLALPSTALSAVVSAASSTAQGRFEPLGVGLKALDALQVLGNEVKGDITAINGLSLDAVKAVRDMTSKAVDMKGKLPTFFNPSASGVVRTTDTTLGLTLLGIPHKFATIAAHVLHALFSYSTGDSWVSFDRTLPITISRMGRTRWGKGWGNFSRVEWLTDIDIAKLLLPSSSPVSHLAASTYLAYITLARQGFGALLLLFEWGTTWPFYMPSLPNVPAMNLPHIGNIPLVGDVGRAVAGLGEQLHVNPGDLGAVVLKAILPTIISNYKKAHAADPNLTPGEVPPAVETVAMPGALA
ncbi:hypothetical protein JB92DRAFT_2901577 [Gautieria morchelliformis]|nr:hypothetical protein JB92DRAFT_2901577 [Gautieria morchelliformis]